MAHPASILRHVLTWVVRGCPSELRVINSVSVSLGCACMRHMHPVLKSQARRVLHGLQMYLILDQDWRLRLSPERVTLLHVKQAAFERKAATDSQRSSIHLPCPNCRAR